MVGNRTGRIFDHLCGLSRFVGEIKAGFDALHRVQFDEPWTRAHRPTYEEWQDFIAPRPRARRETTPREAAMPFATRPASR